MEVRSVSCVSSGGLLLGMLSTRAAWKGVAAQAVILKPALTLYYSVKRRSSCWSCEQDRPKRIPTFPALKADPKAVALAIA